jgi:restriction system protein
MSDKLSRSFKVAAKTIYETFKILKEEGGELPGRDVIRKVRDRVSFTEWEKSVLEKTGNIRWESIMHFYTIDCMKAGYMRKRKGLWILTEEGEAAMKFGEIKLLLTANAKYKEWKKERDKKKSEEEVIEESGQSIQATINKLEAQALDSISGYIKAVDAYDFQEIVASLLKAMGYYIAEIAKKGPDGGIDIIAYNDPLGTVLPRIIVQVKHKQENAVPSEDIQKLLGTMNRGSDVGIFVTSGTFSWPARNEARRSVKHIELINFSRFVELWQQFYPKMSDEDKNKLPLQAIYFLGSNE